MMTRSRSGERGFTLVELMVVVAIVAMVSVYFTNFMINRITHQEVRNIANDMLTLSRAISSYYTEYYRWPGLNDSDPDNPECATNDVFDGYSGLVGIDPEFVIGFDRALYQFDCSSESKVVISRRVDDREIGEIISRYLPSAAIYPAIADDAVQDRVELHVMRPRLPMNVSFFSGEVNDNGYLRVDYPENCPESRRGISVAPEVVCTGNGESLGGFVVNVEPRNNRDRWRVSLETRDDSVSDDYERIETCNGVSGRVRFQGMVFCERD